MNTYTVSAAAVRYLCIGKENKPEKHTAMHRFRLLPLMLLAFLSAEACNPSDEEPYRPGTSVQPEEPGEPSGDGENNPDKDPDEDTMNSNTITLTAGGRSFTATLVENQATEALKARLAQGPVDIRMEDYGDMEKVGSFGFSLPRNDASTTTSPGDMVLYQGNSLVIFYGSNSWSYTRLGRLDDASTRERVLELLGGVGTVTVTLSLGTER